MYCKSTTDSKMIIDGLHCVYKAHCGHSLLINLVIKRTVIMLKHMQMKKSINEHGVQKQTKE